MAGIPTADDKTESLHTLRARWRYVLARIKSDPNAAPYLADFIAFEPMWTAIDQKERAKEDAVIDAEAAADTADKDLDELSRLVVAAIFGGKKVDATLPLATVYFGGLSPSEFTRPRLGKQLTGMTPWPALLAQAPQPALLALAPKASVVPAADVAAKTLIAAIADLDLFHDGGERKSIFDHFNAICATAHSGLKTFALKHPELNLPRDYAESLFQYGASASAPRTLASANALVARLEQKLGKAKTLQAELAQKDAEYQEALALHKKALADAAAAKKAATAALKAKKEAAAAAKKAKPKKP